MLGMQPTCRAELRHPDPAGQDAHLQQFVSFDKAAGDAGDALEASALEPAAAGAPGSPNLPCDSS
jgi:hypothetical protein